MVEQWEDLAARAERLSLLRALAGMVPSLPIVEFASASKVETEAWSQRVGAVSKMLPAHSTWEQRACSLWRCDDFAGWCFPHWETVLKAAQLFQRVSQQA